MFLAEMQLILKLTGKTVDFLPPNLLSNVVFLPRVDYWEKTSDILGLCYKQDIETGIQIEKASNDLTIS